MVDQSLLDVTALTSLWKNSENLWKTPWKTQFLWKTCVFLANPHAFCPRAPSIRWLKKSQPFPAFTPSGLNDRRT